ncbi:hypothetical protein GVAV_002715 [Gurleya vavrai]
MIILISSLISAVVLIVVIHHKLKNKSNQNPFQKNKFKYETNYKEMQKIIKTILESPFSDIKIIDEKTDNENFVFLKNLYVNHKQLQSLYNNERIISLKQRDANKVNHNNYVEQIKSEINLSKDFLELINFMIEKNLLNDLKSKINFLIDDIIENISNFKNVNDMFKHIEIPLNEILHIIGSLAFKYKNFLQKMFFNTSFHKCSSFAAMILSLKYFGIWSNGTCKELLKFKNEQLNRLIFQIKNIRLKDNQSYDSENIHDDVIEFLFKNDKIKIDNYFLIKTKEEDIEATESIYKNIINQSLYDETNESNNYLIKEYGFSDDKFTNQPPEKKIFFSYIIFDYFNNFKYKIFNSKVILYCFEKSTIGKNLEKYLNVERMTEKDRKDKILKFLERFIKFNEQEFIHLFMDRFYIFLYRIQKMKEYSQDQIEDFIKTAIDPLLEIKKEDFEMFAYLIKTFKEKKKI